MIANFTKYAQVKVTPSVITMLSAQNPLEVAPKYVHVTCDHESAPYTVNGYLKEMWLNNDLGMSIGTNGSTGGNTYGTFNAVQQTPTQINTFYLSDTEISIYKSYGSISSRWHTETEYTVHIYA